MTDRFLPILRRCGWLIAFCALGLTAANFALAQSTGRLRFLVKDAATDRPLANARIILKDTKNLRPSFTLTTDGMGRVTSPLLDAWLWQSTTRAANPDAYETDTRRLEVVGGAIVEAEILLEPQQERVLVIHVRILPPRPNPVGTANRIDVEQRSAATAGNPQDLSALFKTNPGVVADSVNQAHPRGEHSSTTYFLNGFELPSALQGGAEQLLIPEVIQTLDILTGGYAPEFGGETAAIVNLTLRSGTIKPVRDASVQVGDYATYDGGFALGGQAGQSYGPTNANGQQAHRFGYLFDLNARRTNNALAPPQPDFQSAHNHGETQAYFGNLGYALSSRDRLTLTVNSTPAYTQISNRTGLPNLYADVGQGFGFGGALSAAQAAQQGIVSQQDAGQDIHQRDVNTFGILNYQRDFNSRLSGLLAYGLVHSGQEIRNNNPAVDLANLPADNSVEFNPTIIRNYRHAQSQGSLTYTTGSHAIKGGLLFDDQEGDESYQLIPDSQAALTALAGIDPGGNLTPPGLLDSDGAYTPPAPGTTANTPIFKVHRSGFYRAGYLQDTWKASPKFTLNYGVRGDWYKQSQNVQGQIPISILVFSPRLNASYAFNTRTTARLSYNRLFSQPPLAQGAIIGQTIQPETLNQYDISIERNFGAGQNAKIAYYVKDIQNQLDTGLLIPGTQIGVFSTVNLSKGNVHGLELSYELAPRGNVGLGVYANYSYSLAQPSGFINGDPAQPADDFNDHDQRNTVNFGLTYTWKSGANAGFDLYHGSGVASSVVFADGKRTPRTLLNFTMGTGSRLFGGHGGLTLAIENLLDDHTVINFNSAFSGTRFQQGRRILLSLNGTF